MDDAFVALTLPAGRKATAVLSLDIRLCWFHHGIRIPGTQAVRRPVQGVPARRFRRGKGLPLQIHRGEVLSLR